MSEEAGIFADFHLRKSGNFSKQLSCMERKRNNWSVEAEYGGVYNNAFLFLIYQKVEEFSKIARAFNLLMEDTSWLIS